MTEAPAAPYPPDTRAKGWRFELDLERVQQSDTWALAAPEERPWLLMLWTTAWQQTPCGSLPADDRIIAARIGMPAKAWSKSREVLLRGWVLHADGRLYHATITERVVDMLARKNAERDRKAAYRARMSAVRAQPSASVPGTSASVPVVSHGTGAGLPWESGGSDATGTGTGTGTGEIQEPTVVLVAGTAPERAASAAPTTRGTRLPAGWQLPRDWGQWALDQPGWTEPAVRTEGEKFRDYWAAKPGRDGVKLDWQATWRNWIRNATPPRSGSVLPMQGRQAAVESHNRSVAEAWLAKEGAS